MNKTALYPGSFDPLTNGHLDLIERGLCVFDKLVVGVAVNIAKKSIFSPEERVEMIRYVTKDLKNIEVCAFNALLIDFATQRGITNIIRGLRAVSDFEIELQMALINRKLAPKIETVFMMPNETYGYLSSGIVKEVAAFGGDISSFVHPHIQEKVISRLKKKNAS